MRRSKSALLVLAAIFMVSSGSLMALEYDECPVIGQYSDPAKGREYFREAMQAWHRGLATEAIDSYEKAIISDHSILRHEDHGMAARLLERYREKADSDSASAAMLCRIGFFENIVAGNMESAIDYYRKAGKISKDDDLTSLATDEAGRLERQLAYIRNWQREVIRQREAVSKQQVAQYIADEKVRALQREVSSNNYEIEELRERLAYLQKSEKELFEELYSTVRTAARNRRRYYYPGSDPAPNPDPDAQAMPSGTFTDGGNIGAGQIPNPYGQQSATRKETALSRYYIYRNRSRRQQDQLDQIKAEISGVARQIKEYEQQNDELRERASESPIK